MSDGNFDIGRRLRREFIVLGSFLIAGLTILPAIVYAVGLAIFGEYPSGLKGFYGEIWGGLAAFGPGTWFLVTSPYLVWQTGRVTWLGMRRSKSRVSTSEPDGQGAEV